MSERPTKDRLKELYVNQKLSLAKIGMRYGVTATAVWFWMKDYAIPRRSLKEAWHCKTEEEKHIQKLCEGARRCRGPQRWNWRPNGSRRLETDGYISVKCSGHPRGDWVPEHILVMERHLGRQLRPHEEIHHRNFDKADNRIDNLQLFDSHSEHLATVNHITKE